MYVTTFYSYKGGVGRTMALINVAFLLAQAGKRVLIVDFDLEAPGIPSFDLFRCAGSRAGVVDYVCSFRDTGRAPDVTDFIVQCADDNTPPIWLMPAGRHTQPGYAEKLYSIDWKDLYDNHEGFLMFEDMRNQWAAHEARFDYVLIDSRTGHTDVGGICTRQLPDAVVVMFLPNEQNIEGLKPIVAAIREEEVGVRGHRIDLHFCPSNVPELDDEDEILSNMLESAKASLGPPAAVIHHYNSLDLLRQPAFAACRPKSSLARQYQALMHAIIERNFADDAGAEWALGRMPNRYEAARRDGDQAALFEIEDAAAQIGSLHSESGKVGWLLSILYSRMGAIEDELTALTSAIDHDHERSRALIRRARLLSSLNRKEPALADLDRLLASGTATVFEILPAIDLLRAIEPTGWVTPIQTAIEQLQANSVAYVTLMRSLMTERDKLPLAVKVGQRAQSLHFDNVRDRTNIRSYLILALIGLGQFQLAMETIGDPAVVLSSRRPDDLFNFAIAQWGADGKPPVPFFRRMIEIVEEEESVPDANLYQCLALAEMVLGDHAAAGAALEYARWRARTGERAFSCWRYLEVTGRAMLNDLTAMEKAVGQETPPEPAFFADVRRLFD
jgi:MinD-like ATPase involved in chromosome partitioning or flagellar assembly